MMSKGPLPVTPSLAASCAVLVLGQEGGMQPYPAGPCPVCFGIVFLLCPTSWVSHSLTVPVVAGSGLLCPCNSQTKNWTRDTDYKAAVKVY
jgi:hypothetical protein